MQFVWLTFVELFLLGEGVNCSIQIPKLFFFILGRLECISLSGIGCFREQFLVLYYQMGLSHPLLLKKKS